MRARAVVALVTALLVVACAATGNGRGPIGTGTTPGTARVEPTVDYGVPGPYAVGTVRLSIGATTAVVFYPVDPDVAAAEPEARVTSYSTGEAFDQAIRPFVATAAPALVRDVRIDAHRDARISAEGPFPLVLHSHGYGGFDLFASHHLSTLASWGFVAAAPEHLSRDLTAAAAGTATAAGDPDVEDLRRTWRALEDENTKPGSPLAGGLDTEHVGAEGHDQGGRAAYLLAAADGRVRVWLGEGPSAPVRADDPAIAAAATPEEHAAAVAAALAAAPQLDKPAVLLAADGDTVVPLADVEALYARLRSPKRLVVVKGTGHAGFLDTCAALRQTDLAPAGEALPALAPLFPLLDDGCTATSTSPEAIDALVDHVSVAAYRSAFGLDRTDASLAADELARRFPEALGRAGSS